MIPMLVDYKTTEERFEEDSRGQSHLRRVDAWDRGVWVDTTERTNPWDRRYTACVVVNFATQETLLVDYTAIKPIGILDMNDMTLVAEAATVPGKRLVNVRRPA